MKRLFLALVLLSVAVSVFACQTTTHSSTSTTTSQTTTTTSSQTTTTTQTTTLPTLASPTNVEITGSVITFDQVEHATKYRLYVYNLEDELIKDFFVTSGFDLLLLLETGTYRFVLKATAPNYQDSVMSPTLEQHIYDINQVSILEEEQLNDGSYIRWMGRTYYNPADRTRYFYFTASGFEVTFYGTELKAFLKASNSSILGKQAYIVVLVDGEEDPTKGTTFVLTQSLEEYTLVSGLEEGFHTVKVLKRSEAIDSNTSLYQISTDGYFGNPPLAKNFRIQYIAASSSTGYGNLGSNSENKSTANSHGLLGFAYLTSYLLDAETSIFSASGWGVSRGWNTGGQISETQNIPAAYQYYAITDANSVFTTPGLWNHTEYIPDVIVVNLGTNDFNASNYNSMSAIQKQALVDRFILDYTNFLVLLNNQYPNAKIIVAYGLMGEQNTLGSFTLQIIQQANTIIGSSVCTPFLMEAAGTAPNPFGSNYHPNVGTSMNVANALANYIQSLTGREIVRDMVVYPPVA